jgi:tetratricopeptide (TPR) repeat protein
MSDDSEKKPETDDQTESQEITGTLTDLGYGAGDADSEQKLKRLLGSKSLKSPKNENVLLMLDKPSYRADLLRAQKIEEPRSSDKAFCILGPYGIDSLKNLVLDGLLRRNDRLLIAGNRWKPLLEEFPEWSVHVQGADDFSRTMEFTQTDTLTSDASCEELDEIEDVSLVKTEGYQLEELDEAALKNSSAPLGRAPEKPTETRTHPKSLELERTEVTPKHTVGTSNRSPQRRTAGPAPFKVALLTLLVVGMVGWLVGSRKEKKSPETPTLFPTHVIETKVRSSLDWPPSLRPRSPDSLFLDENPMLRKIRPVLRAYEAGVMAINQSDEMLLRRYADPASANWEARKLASNQLAVQMMLRSDLVRARNLLSPILQADAADFTTLVNGSLVDIWEERFAPAREALRVASRINSDMRWLTLGLLGVVEGASDRWPAATNSFEDALKAQPNNPYIQGLWLQTLLRKEKGARFQIQKLVTDALWADPDTLIDAPLPAPIASHLIHSEALEGLLRGAESLGADGLSPGKLAYVRWLKGRATGFSTSTPSLAQVANGLELEEDHQSQVLYAYVLKEQERYDEATQILTRVLPLVENSKLTRSSWPWTLAGDAQAARSRYDQAILFYQSALNRNNLDFSAVYGLAMTLRDRGQYIEAEQKLREALALHPTFMPAKLRISRLEWQSLVRAQ